MRLDLRGHPTHTRALSVELVRHERDRLAASASIVDLRKRGFVPVGGCLQGAGIIHHMEISALVDTAAGRLERLEPRQPVVAFEAAPSTCGESCRDPSGRLLELAGVRLDEAPARLREAIGGPAGCSHVLALAQFVVATLQSGDRAASLHAAGEAVLRRDLVFDGAELEEGRLLVGVQMSDLHFAAAPARAAAMERLAAHDELRIEIELAGWPAEVSAISGAERRRTRADFAAARWRDLGEVLAPLLRLSFGRGATRQITERLGTRPAVRDVLLMLGPTLIQLRAAFPDKWLNVAATTPGHPGLVGMPDSCYMWRRGGGLERQRAGKPGRESG